MRKRSHFRGTAWLLSGLLLISGIVAPVVPARADTTAGLPAGLPAFDAAVLAAVEGRLRNRSPESIATDLLVTGSDQITTDRVEGLAALLDGFDLAALTPLSRGFNQDGDFVIEAALYFADASHRLFGVKVTAAYRPATTGQNNEGLGGAELLAADWAPLFAANPVTEMYVLPAVALREADAATLGDYRRFHNFVRAHAIPMQATPGENGTENTVRFHRRDSYAFITFTKAAMAPDARLSIRVADRPETTSGRPADTRYIVYDAFWRAAITGGQFDLDDIDPFWLKAIFHPGADQQDLAVSLVGLYRSHPER